MLNLVGTAKAKYYVKEDPMVGQQYIFANVNSHGMVRKRLSKKEKIRGHLPTSGIHQENIFDNQIVNSSSWSFSILVE